MNIFFLHKDPIVCAQYHCDKHCIKMILETSQLLSTAHRIIDGNIYADKHKLYQSTHKNHPCAKWVQSSSCNYEWAFELFRSLCFEYTQRYNKIHASERLIKALKKSPTNISTKPYSEPPQCMPSEYQNKNTIKPDSVAAYRNYYRKEKVAFARWRYSTTPTWFNENL